MAKNRSKTCPACSATLPRIFPPRCPHCQCILRFGPVVYSDELLVRLDAVVKKSKYPPEAFDFMVSALRTAFAAAGLRGEKHLQPRAVCDAARQLAIVRHGNHSATELQKWGITSSLDIGQLVLELSEAGFCRRDETDTLDSFKDIYVIGDHTWNAIASIRGICGNCGYDLRGSPTYRCPECGTQNTKGTAE